MPEPSGSSVPEAARAAAEQPSRREHWVWLMQPLGPPLPLHDRVARLRRSPEDLADLAMALADAEVAAASVELQQEVDRLSAECEALRGTVAEERATTGRLLARTEELVRAWRMDSRQDFTRFDYADSLARAILDSTTPAVRAALASPGEGEGDGRSLAPCDETCQATQTHHHVRTPDGRYWSKLGPAPATLAASPGEGE